MEKVIFSRISGQRRPEFRQITYFVRDDNGGVFVRKKALNAKAYGHIDELVTNTQKVRELYDDIFNIVDCNKASEGVVDIPFVAGMTMSEKISRMLTEGKIDEAFDEICVFADKLILKASAEFCICEEFISVFGHHKFDGSFKVVSPANVDLIFDNIILSDDGSSNILDCEWVFSFGVPVLYVIFRSVFFHRGLMSLPEEQKGILWQRLGIDLNTRKKFLDMEINFQRFVSGNGRKTDEWIYKIGRPCYCLDKNGRLFLLEKAQAVIEKNGVKHYLSNEFVKSDIPGCVEVMIPDDMYFGNMKVLLAGSGGIIKLEKVTCLLESGEEKPAVVETNCSLQINDDYYFTEKPELSFDCGKCSKLTIEYDLLEEKTAGLAERISLITEKHSLELANATAEDMISALKSSNKEYRDAYEMEADKRINYENAYDEAIRQRDEFEKAYIKNREAYEEESRKRDEFEKAYIENREAYEEESRKRDEFEKAYIENREAYEKESRQRQEYAKAYDEANKTIMELNKQITEANKTISDINSTLWWRVHEKVFRKKKP